MPTGWCVYRCSGTANPPPASALQLPPDQSSLEGDGRAATRRAVRESFRVFLKPPVFDEEKWAWKVAYDCEFNVKKDRLSSGERLTGSGNVWFKGKSPISWDYGYEPHSSFE